VLIPVFSALSAELLPDVKIFHMLDESLLKNTIAAHTLTKATTRRIVDMVESAYRGGAGAVMVTCSSIGPAVNTARELLDFPVFRVDEAMAEAAVTRARRIGVAATLQSTMDPTVSLLKQTAARRSIQIEVVPRVSAGAFEAVTRGDVERHDSMVKAMLTELMAEVDLVVLAQASMARVVASMEDNAKPILSSPELAMRQVREYAGGDA
jgi:Asp/Glu/hydantoin racemase